MDTETSVDDPWTGNVDLVTNSTDAVLPLPTSLDDAPIIADRINPPFTSFPEDPLVRAVVEDKSLSLDEKKNQLQRLFSQAASNGDIRCVESMLEGKARELIDLDAEDEEGMTPLIHASCFGHYDIVRLLLDSGAQVDKQDNRRWSALMWATTNSQTQIVRLLMESGASPSVKTGTGRTAIDFLGQNDSNKEIAGYLYQSNGDNEIGSVGVSDDWYDKGFDNEKFEEQLAESDRRRRMLMESAFNLEVDISSLGLEERFEDNGEDDEGPEFVWDRCLPDQMFVFTESDMPQYLDMVITNMLPQRSTGQKPIPANFIFLASRYAHYYQNPEMLSNLLDGAVERIVRVIQSHQEDMTIHAFWISNTCLLLYYFRKDPGLMSVTVAFQVSISELLQEAYLTLLRDAERRLNRILDKAILDNETIQGLDDLHFGDEWRLFRSRTRSKTPKSRRETQFSRTPSPRRRAEPSPRNVTSLLSSIQFILEAYDVHPVIISQCQAQLFSWLGAELFNRILGKRKYLARSKAMQVRLNVSALEDWLRANVRNSSSSSQDLVGSSDAGTHIRRTAGEIARQFLGHLIQLLQWLQVLSSLGEEEETFRATVKALDMLSPGQLLNASSNYRVEVGEQPLAKKFKDLLIKMQAERDDARTKRRVRQSHAPLNTPPTSPTKSARPPTPSSPRDRKLSKNNEDLLSQTDDEDDNSPPDSILLNSHQKEPFALPTSTEMIMTYGAGIGGVERERYIPSLPPEFIEKLDNVSSGGTKDVPLGGVVRTWVEEEKGTEERVRADLIEAYGGARWSDK